MRQAVQMIDDVTAQPKNIKDTKPKNKIFAHFFIKYKLINFPYTIKVAFTQTTISFFRKYIPTWNIEEGSLQKFPFPM